MNNSLKINCIDCNYVVGRQRYFNTQQSMYIVSLALCVKNVHFKLH